MIPTRCFGLVMLALTVVPTACAPPAAPTPTLRPSGVKTANGPSPANWTQWRGPEGNSVSHETGLAFHWSETEGHQWKVPLPEWGNSTPAIWGNALFLTSHTADTKLIVLRLNRTTGKIEWIREVGFGKPFRGKLQRGVQVFHRWHNMASPSPVVRENRVVVHFGTGTIATLDFSGEILWKRNLQQDHAPFTIWWGYASSPVVHDGRVITVCMQDSMADQRKESNPSYLVAHDLETGDLLWKTLRPTQARAEQCDAYTTPLLTTIDDRPQLIVMGASQLDAYDPVDGRRLWFLPGLTGGRTVASPTAAEGVIYAVRGFRGPLFAVQTGGRGRLPQNRVRWSHVRNTPDSCSPLFYRGLLFSVSDDGIVQCLDATTGKLQWRTRLRGPFRASPIVAEDRVYLANSNGLCTVLAAERKLKKLAANKIGDYLMASPVVYNGTIYLRGRKAMYAIKPRSGSGD